MVISRFQLRTQAILNCITWLLAIGLFVFLAWQEFIHMVRLWQGHVGSIVLIFPTFPFAGAIAFGFTLMVIVLVRDFLDYLSQAVIG